MVRLTCYKLISEKANVERYGFNDFGDSYNSSTFQNYSAYATEISATLEQIDKPYFGRLDLSKY
jgi:hypothetical protein